MNTRKLVEDSRGDLLQAEVQTITPEQAKAWLDGHRNIRPINWRNVASFARDMKTGNWKITHQGICFNERDELVDGQHRLHAIIQADRPVRMLVSVIRGITPKDPIDEGRRRSLSLLSGYRTRVVSALGVLRYFELGERVHRPLTLSETTDIYARHEGAMVALSAVPGVNKLTGGTLAALVWAWPTDPEKVERFAHEIASGEMIKRGDPSFAFRNWKHGGVRVAHPEDTALAACNCIRAYLADQQLANVYTGESGYRAIVALRRRRGILNTPDVETVEGIRLLR